MDKNFHYYVTFTSAMEAGFTVSDAETIAQAAQYVDEDENTCHSNSTLVYKNILDGADSIVGKNSVLKDIAKVWPIFHFLPGNECKLTEAIHTNLKNHSNPFVRLGTKLICTPESNLVKVIVDEAKNRYNQTLTRQQKLIRIGITMHVLADTFAHQYFVGLPLKSVNDLGSVYKEIKESKMVRVKWSPIAEIGSREAYSPGLSETSFGYLGHGRIGHLPDEPGAFYAYHPNWLKYENQYLCKDNAVEFYCAFIQMTEAMQYIKGDINNFNQVIDKSLFFDQSTPIASGIKEITDIFRIAGKDNNLVTPWFRYFNMWTKPSDYEKPTLSTYKMDFMSEAIMHRDVVLNHCTPLAEFIYA